ncbi:MAG TPA: iron ABC transporter permease [Ktedonobacterales bacterium]
MARTLTTAAHVTNERRALPAFPVAFVLFCLLGLAVIALLDFTLPTPRVSPGELWAITQGGSSEMSRVVVLQLRLPRLLLGLLAGAMLALSGTMLQDALRNVLAGPELLGVSSGATIVVAAITILHLPVLLAAIPGLALVGGLVVGGGVILAMRQVQDPVRLVLVGAALTALLNAGIIVLLSYGSQSDVGVLFLFLVGSLANRSWPHVQLILPWAVICIPLALALARPLNALQLGDDMARGLGVHVGRMRVLILLLSAALVAAVVAVCGPIAFVALLAPHLARRLLRTSDARLVLPMAALLGALLLSGADLLAHVLFDPMELPVGLFTALVGGPLLILLLRRQLTSSSISRGGEA